MRRDRVAEFLLSCVLPSERAAAVTGDFLEEAESRGSVWFWSSVLRLVSSQIWAQWKASPLELAGIGVRGFFVCAVSTAVYVAGFVALAFPLLFLMGWARNEDAYHPVIVLGSCAAAYSTGKCVGRRAPERELAACLGLVCVPLVILFGVVATIPFWGMEKISLHGVRWTDFLGYGAAIYGALQARLQCDGRKPVAQG